MRHARLALPIGPMLLLAWSAMAQTNPSPAPTPQSPSGGIGDYWWLIILALVGIAVVFYLMRGSKKH